MPPIIADPPPFDALDCAQRLRAADVPEKQAEAMAEILRAVFAGHGARVAVETDARVAQAIGQLTAYIDARFAEARRETDARFAEVRREMDARFAEARHGSEVRFAEMNERFAEMNERFAEAQRETGARFAEARHDSDVRFAAAERATLQLKAEMQEMRAEMRGQFRLHNWMLAAVLSGLVAVFSAVVALLLQAFF